MEYIFNNKLVQIKDFTLNDYNIYIDIYGERDYVADGYYKEQNTIFSSICYRKCLSL